MIHTVTIKEFYSLPDPPLLADVRTPAEFLNGHIPGACNLPLFSNEERVQVGTTYKQVGREAAIMLGFDLTGNKWSGFIKQALEWASDKRIGLHCWRGGMRSGAMAWALDLYGFDVYLLQGGYKAYRQWVLQQFDRYYALMILGGMTGSGKTSLLHELRNMGEQVIDLEALAQHQGSAYGSLDRLVQPSQEQFENDLACQLNVLNTDKTIWVEDESNSIGKCFIPRLFWLQMQQATLVDVQVPIEQRVQNLLLEYGCLPQDFLVTSTERIRKRLGPEQTNHAIIAIRENQMEDFIKIVLVYYDKTYKNGLAKRDKQKVFVLPVDGKYPAGHAKQVLQMVK
ncbi:MAG: tRNA 2-selenouridine(34) synthase MnmH [Chitinophagaceae bacterium]|nr:tRNA 2-selenouridine(34) synthase MnmH [Chitinophagaceae bacterium]